MSKSIEALVASSKYAIDVETVLLTGGVIRIPPFQLWIRQKFGSEKISLGVNADESVSKGAVLWSAINHPIFQGGHKVKMSYRNPHDITAIFKRQGKGIRAKLLIFGFRGPVCFSAGQGCNDSKSKGGFVPSQWKLHYISLVRWKVS